MPRDSSAKFKRFNLIRRMTRESFVYGFRAFDEYMYIQPKEECSQQGSPEVKQKLRKKTGYSLRAYKEKLQIARGCLESAMDCPPDKALSIAYKKTRVISNPFYRLLKANVMLAGQQFFFFALMDMMRRYPSLTVAEIKGYYADICDNFSHKEYIVRNYILGYLSLGLLVKQREKNRDLFALAPLRPYDGSYSDIHGVECGIFGRHKNFLNAVSFFSEVSPLGIVGSQILDVCNTEQNIFAFKNSYISQTLDSIVLADILEAIQQKQFIEVRAEQTREGVVAVSNVLPVCILSSVWDGRQYVFVYDTKKKWYKSQRLDFIYSVAPGKNPDLDIDDVTRKGQEVLRTMWGGNYMKQEAPAHVVISFAFDAEKEKHINERIERECREPLTAERYAGTGERKAEGSVCHPLDLVPWLLSYTGYIDHILVEGTKKQREVLNRICEHIQNLYRRYHYGSKFEYTSLERYKPITKEYLEKWDIGEDTSPIFSDINSYYSVSLKRMLPQFSTPKTKREALAIIKEANETNGFKDSSFNISLQKLCDNGMLTEDTIRGEECYTSVFTDKQCRPFTTYELRWLYTILQDPKISLFLQQNEADHLKEVLETNGATALYTDDSFRYFDAYSDGDDYSNPVYREHFETVSQAITDENAPLQIEYVPESGCNRNASAVRHCVVPIRLEYSKLDDKFKLVAYEIGEKTETKKHRRQIKNLQVFRISRMMKVERVPGGEAAPGLHDYDTAKAELNKPVEVIVYPFKNVLERFFISFSAYRKSVEYDENTGVCHVKLWFIARDHKEVYAKLRSFGQGVEIVSPDQVRREYFIRRVDRQYWNFIRSGLLSRCATPLAVKVRGESLDAESFKRRFQQYQITIEPDEGSNSYTARIWFAQGDEPYVRAELNESGLDIDIQD